MFVRREKTEADLLRKKIRQLSGKTTQEKFKAQLKLMLPKLDRVEAFNRYFDATLNQEFKRVRDDYHDLVQTTSREAVLESMLICDEDLDLLLEDMLHGQAEGTYDSRLKNILAFLKDFENTAYQRNITFFDEASSKFDDQLKGIARDIQGKVSKMTYQAQTLTDEINVLENENIKLVKALENLSPDAYQFKDTAHKIEDQHGTIENHQASIQLLRKTMSGYRLLASLFNQLALMDEYYEYLKTDGYIRKLVKKLYRKPKQLDVLENTVDLTDTINKIKEEVMQVESIVKPAKKMVFEDLDNEPDSSILDKYKSMAK